METSFSRRNELKEWDRNFKHLQEQIENFLKGDRVRNSYKWEHINEDISNLANKERTLNVKIQNLFRLINDQSLKQSKNQIKLAKMLTENLELCLKSNLSHKNFILKKCWQKVAKIQIKYLLNEKNIDPNKHPKEALKRLKLKQQSLFWEYQKLNHKRSYYSALSDLQDVEKENQRAIEVNKTSDFVAEKSLTRNSPMQLFKQTLEINSIDAKLSSKNIASFRESFLTYEKNSKKVLGRYRELCRKILDNRTDSNLREELQQLAGDIEGLKQTEKDLDSKSKKLLQPKVRSAQILVKKQESDALSV